MNSSIGGEQNPTIGKEYNYFITDMLDVNLTITNEVSTYIWHIYVKLKNGKIVDITKDGGKIGSEVPYSFSEKAINKEYILVVNRATKKLLSTDYKFEKIAEFHIFPTTSTEIKIEKVILFNKGAKDVNKASYTDTLVARAYCIGMVNKEIEFQLWEDDAKGKGHDAAINKNNTDSKFIFKATVNQKGIAEVKIPLSSDPKLLQKIANKYLMAGDKTEGANHEYYVTASYLGDIKGASQVNVDVKNPDNNKTQNAPKKESAIFPVDKGVAKPDINKKIINAYFADKNNKRITKVIVGTQLYVVIHTNSMVDKYIQYVIWEKDSSGNHDPIHRSNRLKVTGNLMSIKSIFVTKNIFEKGIDFSLLDPDAEKQNYYIEVIAPDLEAKSRHFGVTLETGLLEVEKTKSVVVVNKQEKKETPTGKCPNCEKDITISELQQVYTKANSEKLKELAKVFNKYKKQYKLDTCARKAHFFAQSIQETGVDLAPGIRGESFDYYKDNLAINLKAFETEDGKRIAKTYGRKETSGAAVIEANQIVLANYAYGYQYTTGKDFNNTGKNDGWNFRGRGLLQITGRSNYEAIQKRIDKFASDENVNIFKKYDSPNKAISIDDGYMSVTEATLTGMADWYKDDMYAQADKTGTKPDDDVVDLIINIINKHTDSKQARRDHYQKTKVTFFVDNCININKKEVPKSNSNGKWRTPIDNPMLCLYSQKGGEKPWHGSFGEKIRDNSANHSGCDLFALPGTPVYACIKGKIDRVYTSTTLAGNTVVIEITDKEIFNSLRRSYTLLYKNKGEILEKGFKSNKSIFLVFMHLSKFGKFKTGDIVEYNDIIGYTGISGKNGKNFTTRNPHLHFEINNVGSSGGLDGKCNPMLYFKFKTENELSETEKNNQLTAKNKEWS